MSTPKMPRRSDRESQDRAEAVRRLFKRLDGYATWHAESARLLRLIDGFMLSLHANLDDGLVRRLWEHIDDALAGAVGVVEAHEPVLYRERGRVALARDILGGHFGAWAEQQTDAPPDLRERARQTARLVMARTQERLMPIEDLLAVVGMPPRVGPPRRRFPREPNTIEEAEDLLSAACDAIEADQRDLTQAEVASLWTTDEEVERGRVLDERFVRAFLDSWGIDWRDFLRRRAARKRP